MFTKRIWSVSHSLKDGGVVHLENSTPRARLWSLAFEVFEFIDSPGHWSCSPREWEFRIPLGHARRDEDGFIENSLGGWHYERVSQFMIWMMNREEAHTVTVADLPIDDETFKKVSPDMAFLVEDDEDED